MNLRSSCCLFSFFFIIALGCEGATEGETLFEAEEVVDDEQGDPSEDAPIEETYAEESEDGFDACPEDTYYLWSKSGRLHEVRIQVFCEPIMLDINLGCPAPFTGEQDN